MKELSGAMKICVQNYNNSGLMMMWGWTVLGRVENVLNGFTCWLLVAVSRSVDDEVDVPT